MQIYISKPPKTETGKGLLICLWETETENLQVPTNKHKHSIFLLSIHQHLFDTQAFKIEDHHTRVLLIGIKWEYHWYLSFPWTKKFQTQGKEKNENNLKTYLSNDFIFIYWQNYTLYLNVVFFKLVNKSSLHQQP